MFLISREFGVVANITKVGRQKDFNLQGKKDAQSLEKYN